MTCDHIEERLPLLRYGELEVDERLAVLGHLEGCAACREAQAALDASAAALESVPLRHPDAARARGLKDRVLAAVAPGCPREEDLLDPGADTAAHLAQCASCTDASAAFAKVGGALDAAPLESPGPAALATSKAAILARTGTAPAQPAGRLLKLPAGSSQRGRPARFAAAAAVVLLSAGAFALGRATASGPGALKDRADALVRQGEVVGERAWVAPAIQAYEDVLDSPSSRLVLAARREVEALRALAALPARPTLKELEQFIVSHPDAHATAARALEEYVSRERPRKYPLGDMRGPWREQFARIVEIHRNPHLLQVIELRDGMHYEELEQLTQARERYERVLELDASTPAAAIARERLEHL